eukprot:gnl/TRDRNA2_/TRDRNA2_87725_c1_seq1.p1 gnl/TRDRNA2_/TRDRNA2_87725_c1~~gnl/TRDRNA2_/TRDRNA2_87725_c1_seq1.p1  ORF type:complete len:260 (-),score=48.38 gnl/TRDRNA2_/TRDRNA2_87725_c1_seq1:159-914(-)
MSHVQPILDVKRSGDGCFPALLQQLPPGRFGSIVESDDLPLATEAEVFELVAAYLTARGLGGEATTAAADVSEATGVDRISPEEATQLLLTVRWRLVPGPLIAKTVMQHPAVLGTDGSVRAELLPVLADGMRYHLVSGDVRELPPAPQGAVSSCLRTHHRIAVRDFASLTVGTFVRVIDDAVQLRKLCMRVAPGARYKVDWVAGMKVLVGARCRVHSLVEGACAAELDEAPGPNPANGHWIIPFDALLLAK